MTTSDPRAEHRDDSGRENRGLGQRILDAVLGEPGDDRTHDRTHDRAGDRTDPATPQHVDENRGVGAPEGFAGDGPRTEHTSYEQAMRDAPPAAGTGTAAGQAYDERRDAVRDAGYAPSGAADDARRDAGLGSSGTATDARRDAGDDALPQVGHDPAARTAGQGTVADGRDPLAPDAPRDLGSAGGYTTDRPADRPADRDAGFGAAVASDAVVTDRGSADRGTGQDFVTGSYDPDRDTGYDPQAAGTAVQTDPSQGPVARNTRSDTDHDSAQGTGYVDESRSDTRDYDPARDTGYVDAARTEADRTTGRRDDDYDTGRVDVDGGRVATEPVDTDRTDRDSHRGAGTAAAGAAGAAAAAIGSSHHDRDRDDSSLRDRDDSSLRDRDDRAGDATFSEVDDTVTVDDTATGRGTPDTGADQSQAGVADEDGASGTRERLVPADRAEAYGSRWDALKGDFVDEPRRAVRSADELVGEVLDELQRLFADQRRDLEQSFNDDRASTEDLRLALRRYRSFFDRLLSF